MDFQEYWAKYFGHAAPVGYELRETQKETWLRIHSLKDSQRYPEDQAEIGEVLKRHNEVAGEILGEGSPCWFVTSRFREPGEPTAIPKFQVAPNLDLVESFSRAHESDLLQTFWVSRTRWSQGAFDELIEQVAQDEVRFLLVSIEKSQIYAPYDGGADLILKNSDVRNKLKSRWSDWLSTHPDGL